MNIALSTIVAFLILMGMSDGSAAQAEPRLMPAELLEHRQISGRADQGVALADQWYFGATSRSICRFTTDWELVETKPVSLPGVNHLGAIDYHDGYIWGGFLHGPVGDGSDYDPADDRAIIAKIRAKDLRVMGMWDITDDVTWIDPVYFDGEHLWVGDASDLGIHRYHFDKQGSLVRDGIFRYQEELHFSQGIRIVGDKLYSIHCFGSMKGLYEFQIPEQLTEQINYPTRVWNVEASGAHLEGFDFIPGQPDQIWHAQFDHVDRWKLEGLAGE